MKISFIITNLATGGAEIMLFKLLSKIDRSRFSPTVISLMSLGEVGPRISALGIPVTSLNMRRGAVPSPFLLWRLFKLLRLSQPDIVHTWMYHADLLGGLAARLSGCRRVVWCIRQGNLSKSENKRSTLWVVKVCAILSRVVPIRILSCSHRARDVHVLVGYSANKMEVIPNGFDLRQFIPNASARDSVRSELGMLANTPLVGLVARYDSQKNHPGFLVAASILNARRPDVHFLLAGQGVDAENITFVTAIAQMGMQSNMHLLGRRDDMPRVMAALDVLASSSHGEAFPNVLGEAMACGVPCVVTDVGDSAEIVGNTGRVVKAGDMVGLANGMLELLDLPHEQLVCLGVLARNKVACEYEIDLVASQYMEFYVRLIADKNFL